MYSSLSHSVPEALEFAAQYGHEIKLMIHKVTFYRKILKHTFNDLLYLVTLFYVIHWFLHVKDLSDLMVFDSTWSPGAVSFLLQLTNHKR